MTLSFNLCYTHHGATGTKHTIKWETCAKSFCSSIIKPTVLGDRKLKYHAMSLESYGQIRLDNTSWTTIVFLADELSSSSL